MFWKTGFKLEIKDINSVEYKIITEDLNREKIFDLIKYHFDGFTIQGQLGYWENKIENSVCFVIIAPKTDRELVHLIARQIQDLNSQECVLVTETPITVKFI